MESSASAYLQCGICHAQVVGEFGLQQHRESSKRCMAYRCISTMLLDGRRRRTTFTTKVTAGMKRNGETHAL